MIVNAYSLNMIPDRVLPLVMVSQYDTSRCIVFNLFNGTEEYQPTSAKVLIGTNQYEGQVNGNQVIFNVPSELTQTAQYLFGEIVATDSNGKMGSLNFKFKVDSTPMEVIQTNTLSMAKPLSNGLKTALDLKLEEQKDEPIEEPIEEPTEEEAEEPTEEEAEPIEEPIEEEQTEEETEPIEESTEEEQTEPIEETEETEEPIEEPIEEENTTDGTETK